MLIGKLKVGGPPCTYQPPPISQSSGLTVKLFIIGNKVVKRVNNAINQCNVIV